MTWGLYLGANNLTKAILEVKSLVKAFANKEVKAAGVTLDHIELGNEPDLHRNNGLCSPNCTAADFTAEYVVIVFSPQAVFDAGILVSDPGKFIKT